MGLVLPVAKALYVCDDLISDSSSNKFLIVGACNAVRLPKDAAFPYVLNKLCIFAQLVGGINSATACINVVQASTG